MRLKICGISDSKTLNYITAHQYSPEYIGFIVNYPKSKRFVEFYKLKNLLTIDKGNSKYVAVLVNPNEGILEKIKDLPFDYYQIYDCSTNKIKSAISLNSIYFITSFLSLMVTATIIFFLYFFFIDLISFEEQS